MISPGGIDVMSSAGDHLVKSQSGPILRPERSTLVATGFIWYQMMGFTTSNQLMVLWSQILVDKEMQTL